MSGRSFVPSAPWKLRCSWCDHYLIVNARGAHGKDSGSGVEAARLMAAHIRELHGKPWSAYLRMLDRAAARDDAQPEKP